MVPGEATGLDRGLVDEVRVEVFVAEAGRGCVECGVGELDAGCFDEHCGFGAGDLLRQPEVLGQGQVSGHRASRSKSS